MKSPLVNGLRVILSDGGHSQPVRTHSKKANGHKFSYHLRVQKKWLKRFGQHWIETQKRGETFIIGNHSLVVRKDDWPILQQAIADCEVDDE